jgi:hypothetical protein
MLVHDQSQVQYSRQSSADGGPIGVFHDGVWLAISRPVASRTDETACKGDCFVLSNRTVTYGTPNWR